MGMSHPASRWCQGFCFRKTKVKKKGLTKKMSDDTKVQSLTFRRSRKAPYASAALCNMFFFFFVVYTFFYFFILDPCLWQAEYKW